MNAWFVAMTILLGVGALILHRYDVRVVQTAPVGKYPVGKYPVGKTPVGKYRCASRLLRPRRVQSSDCVEGLKVATANRRAPSRLHFLTTAQTSAVVRISTLTVVQP
jgi:hypothetical protein